MKAPLQVCCALITIPSAEGPLLMAARKAHGQPNARLYEFPGGKLEPGETPQDAIIREIREEMACEVIPVKELTPVLHPTPQRDILLIPLICKLAHPHPLPVPLEHESLGFFSQKTLPTLPWAPADREILAEWQCHKEH